MQVNHFKSQSDDPLDYSPEGSLIWHVCAQGRRARAYGDLAVVELRAQRRTGLTCESDLVRVWSHRVIPRSPLVRRTTRCTAAIGGMSALGIAVLSRQVLAAAIDAQPPQGDHFQRVGVLWRGPHPARGDLRFQRLRRSRQRCAGLPRGNGSHHGMVSEQAQVGCPADGFGA